MKDNEDSTEFEQDSTERVVTSQTSGSVRARVAIPRSEERSDEMSEELTAQAAEAVNEVERLREGLRLYRELNVLIAEGFDDTQPQYREALRAIEAWEAGQVKDCDNKNLFDPWTYYADPKDHE